MCVKVQETRDIWPGIWGSRTRQVDTSSLHSFPGIYSTRHRKRGHLLEFDQLGVLNGSG